MHDTQGLLVSLLLLLCLTCVKQNFGPRLRQLPIIECGQDTALGWPDLEYASKQR